MKKTIFLTVLITVLIMGLGITGFLSYKFYNEKNDLEEQIKNISNKTSENNTETEKDNTKSNTTSESEELSFSNKEVEEALENYLELAGKLQGAPMNVVEELDLCEDGEYINAKITNDNYIITKIKYDAFKNKMLKYVTEELFEKEFGEKYFKEEDGMLYVADVGATGMEFEVNKVELKDEDDKKTYIAKYDYIIDDEEDLKESLEAEFEIDNNDGRCVIASFEEK